MKTSNKILLFGSGDTARVVIDIVENEDKFHIVGLIDNKKEVGTKVVNYEIIGNDDSLPEIMNNDQIVGGIVAIGDNFLRFTIVQSITRKMPFFNFVNAIHPSAIISRDVNIGFGVIIVGGVVINSNAKIGNFCLLNTKCSIDHDCIVKDYANIAPAATIGGNSKIGDFSTIALGANVINDITIGDHTLIGAGSTVLANIPSFVVAFGTPCVPKRERKVGEKTF